MSDDENESDIKGPLYSYFKALAQIHTGICVMMLSDKMKVQSKLMKDCSKLTSNSLSFGEVIGKTYQIFDMLKLSPSKYMKDSSVSYISCEYPTCFILQENVIDDLVITIIGDKLSATYALYLSVLQEISDKIKAGIKQ
jgi:hypothetical protein